MNKEIVLTGIGIVSGMGLGKDEFWTTAKSSSHSIKIKDEFSDYELPPQYFGECKSFNIREHFKLRPPFPNYYSQLGLLATKYAIEDSRLDMETFDPYEIGCILNTYYGSNQSVEKYLTRLFERGPKRVSPLTFTQTTVNHIVGDIARYFEFRGPSTITMGEESISLGIKSIQSGQAKVMVCGGIDHVREFHLKTMYDNDECVQPGSSNADDLFSNKNISAEEGRTVMGESSCFLVIEEKEHAIARGAHIYAEITGVKSAFDNIAATNYYQRDSGLQTRLIQKSLAKADVDIKDVNLMVGNAPLPYLIKNYDQKVMNEVGFEGTYTSILTRMGDCRAANTPLSLAVAALALESGDVPGCGYETDQFGDNAKIDINKDCKKVDSIQHSVLLSTQLGGSTSCFVLKNANA